MNNSSPAVTLITDLQGTELTQTEREWLTSPCLGGLILFSRNFQSREQLAHLLSEVRQINPNLIITVDHEGGRVQRFLEGFTQVPAMGNIGKLAEQNLMAAKQCAKAAGLVLGYELRQAGVHLTYAPVLDLDYGHNQVIAERSFGSDPALVAELAAELIAGLKQLDMAAVAKHFPGHGWVKGDSHLMSPVDERTLEEIRNLDMQPFVRLLDQIDWMMPAHIVYEQADSDPAGFSTYWLQIVLRQSLKFEGPIVSDDLSMEGAAIKGSYSDRAEAAMAAGCNILLACNSPKASTTLLDWLEQQSLPQLDLSRYQPTTELGDSAELYQSAINTLAQYQLIPSE